MRSRILFSSKTAEPTGPTTSLGLLVERLAERHEVMVLFPGDGEFRKRLEGKDIRYRSVPSLGRRSIPGLVHFLRREGFDLVYVNEVSRASRHVCIAATLAGIPFVSHVRSMGWDHGWTRLAHLRMAKAVIAVSKACGDSVARYVRSGRLHVVHNGVPESLFETTEGATVTGVKEELGLDTEARLVLHVSHLTPRKGQTYALGAIKRLSEVEHGNVHLCFVGALDRDQPYVDQLRSLASESGLEGRVRILGFRADVPRLLRSADVLLHTALADPHPRAVLEGMAAGVPVVAFATDGVVETVVDGETGYLVRPHDEVGLGVALARVLDDEEVRRKMGEAGKVRSQQYFGETRTSREIASIVDRVLAATKSEP